ncbi:ubiquitin-specific protease UBP2 [Sporobolomyces koalae]|uniref:ubiquitin-specific protease UBP2 n=1 Tax=Sporobolomyces koalae TaxID=500713 RepID=UPI0031758E2E
MAPLEGSPEGPQSPTAQRPSYAAASQASSRVPPATGSAARRSSTGRTRGPTVTVPAANFFASSSSSSSTVPEPALSSSPTAPSGLNQTSIDSVAQQTTGASSASRPSVPAPAPARPPPVNPWLSKPPLYSKAPAESPNEGWTTHVIDLSTSTASSPIEPSSPHGFDDLSLQSQSEEITLSSGPTTPIAPKPSKPVQLPTGSAQPACENDGRWTTARIVAREGDGGSKAGIWKYDAFEFDAEPTKPDDKYKAMGEWINLAKSEDADPTAIGDENKTEESGSCDEPTRGFRTVQESELAAIRPHPNLFFCCETLSWALFAKLDPADSTFFSAPGVELWRFELMSDYRKDLESHLSVNQALFKDLCPPMPRPIGAKDPQSLRTVPASDFPREQHESLRSLKLSWAASTKRNRILFSTQEFFPPILGSELWKSLLETRGEHPQVGQTSQEAAAASVNFVWRALDDLLFKGETRALPIQGRTFSKAMPWDDISCDVFLSVLGYNLIFDGTAIMAPSIDHRSREGQENRERLLRAWLELGIWLQDYSNRSPNDRSVRRETRIKLASAKPTLVKLAGGDDLTRIDASQAWIPVSRSGGSKPSTTSSAIDPLARCYSTLGCTPDMSDDSVIKVYDTQIQVWRQHAPEFFEALVKIANARNTEKLSIKDAFERSKGFVTRTELDLAYSELRLPADVNPDHLEEDVLVEAFTTRSEAVTHPERRKVLKEAFKLIADHRKSELLQTILLTLSESEGDGDGTMQGVETNTKMSVDKAYKSLEVETAMDDDTIAMVYQVRTSDAKDDQEKTKMRAALEAIAEERNSDQLRALLREEGSANVSSDTWQVVPAVKSNLPVGLTNIANTCYLNSLLQYFFTVRELREAVLAFSSSTSPDPNVQSRVGGRLVTAAEVDRSQRFVILLRALFEQLSQSQEKAVTPETELAYLALVPGKEEFEAERDRKAKEAARTNREDDDIIIVDPSEPDSQTLARSKSPSVLGKRRTEDKEEEEEVPMLLDGSLPASVMDLTATTDESETNGSGDSEMVDASSIKPSLSRASSTTLASSSDHERLAKKGRSVDQSQSEDVRMPGGNDQEFDLQQRYASPPPLPSTSSSVHQTGPAQPEAPPLPPRPAQAPPAPVRRQTKQEQLEAEVNNYMSFGRQNDVTECMDNVMFQVEAALQANVPRAHDEGATGSLLKSIFYGKNSQKLVFDDLLSTEDPIRTQEEPFFSLLVDVPPSSFDRDIYDGLDTVFDDAPVEIEGKSARRSVSLLQLPPVLQIQLQRVQYDREKGRIFKSNAHLKFPETIDLGRYVESDENDPQFQDKKRRSNELRSKLEKTRTRLAKLEHNTNQSRQLRDALDHFATISDELEDLLSPTLSEDTAMEAQDLEREIKDLHQRIETIRNEMTRVWQNGVDQAYEVCAVFMHRGTASSGHYFIYQRDSRDPTRWLKYNDAVITVVDRQEVFRETTNDTNPYFLVYCRKDRLDAIESVKREIA